MQELALATKNKTKLEIMLQANGCIHRKQYKVQFSAHVLVISAKDAGGHFFIFFGKKRCLQFHFQEWA